MTWKIFWRTDSNCDHAEWTADGHFFVFTTGSSGGHQPQHVATYFYSLGRNRFYSVDSIVGAVLSDFVLRRTVLSTTRMGVNADDPETRNSIFEPLALIIADNIDAVEQIVGRERRERVSHHNWSGDG